MRALYEKVDEEDEFMVREEDDREREREGERGKII